MRLGLALILCALSCDSSKPAHESPAATTGNSPHADRALDCTVLFLHADWVSKLSTSPREEVVKKLRDHQKALREYTMADADVRTHRDAYVRALETAVTKLERDKTSVRDALKAANDAIASAKATCGDVPLPPLE